MVYINICETLNINGINGKFYTIRQMLYEEPRLRLEMEGLPVEVNQLINQF